GSLIDRRSRPDPCTGWTKLLGSGGALASGLRRILNGEGLPKTFAGGGVERDDTASEGATLVFGIGGDCLFEGREGLVDDALVLPRRAGGNGGEMIDRPDFPDQRAGFGIHRVYVRTGIRKEHRLLVLGLARGRAGAERAIGVKSPKRTARVRV